MTTAAHPHPARVRVGLGWALAVATVVLCGAGSHFGDAARAYLPSLPRAAQQDFRLTPIFAIAFAVVGSLIVWRRPRNRIGWVCCGIGILWGLEEFVLGFSSYVAYAPHPAIPDANLWHWLVGWIWIPPVILTFFFLPFLFPNGEPVSPRWWSLAWVALAGAIIGIAGQMTGITALSLSGQLIDLTCAVLAPITLVIRYRRAPLEERQQIKWFAGAALVLAGLTLVAVAVSFTVYHNGDVVFNPVGGTMLPLGLTGVAAAIGIAVLRYHLYDIGVFLRRALVYAALVALIGAIYLVLVVSVGTSIDAPTTTAPSPSSWQRLSLSSFSRCAPACSGWRTGWLTAGAPAPTRCWLLSAGTCPRSMPTRSSPSGWPASLPRGPKPTARRSGCGSATSCGSRPHGRRTARGMPGCHSSRASHRPLPMPPRPCPCDTRANCWERWPW
jgi:hypothetical protein